MKRPSLNIVIILVAISLNGLVFTQIFWLKRELETAENQYDDRADRMLTDVMGEMQEFADTSTTVNIVPFDQLNLFDVIDTSLLANLIEKYVNYHRLDTIYEFAIVKTSNDEIIYASSGFNIKFEEESYKDCFSCLWKKEYVHLSVYFPNRYKNIYMELTMWIVISIAFLIIITGAFVYVIYNIIRQKKISEIKNDFINNMTHEFKTPISTISLASEILIKGAGKPIPENITKYSKIILDENKRMQSQVELVLQTALIDKGKIRLNKEITDLNELVRIAVESFCLEDCDADTKFSYELKAKNPSALIDTAHIRNVISNIIDNAVKYSSGAPVIRLMTRNVMNGFQIAISDNGIGISKEAQKKIFDKFYRISTGNIHNVKGFGLGLYYVKSIVEAHHGEVSVQSNLNNGSTFYVYLPQEQID
ncbi:MAG: HAMP domain-containing histidine kinase [Bacteroidales bacterium]|nr:HAMP domain-containing histidine kinase [Bacteroidales bacterium]